MKTLILILLSFIAINLAFAQDAQNSSESWIPNLKNPFVKKEIPQYDRFLLRGGFSFTTIEMRSDKLIDKSDPDDDSEDETRTFGLGLNSSVAYRWRKWEFSIASDFIVGPVRETSFIHNQSAINGKGHFRLISIGPQFKYHLDYTLFDRANFYIGFGPIWSLQTYVFTKSEATGDFNNKKRISFENYGASFLIGLEEFKPKVLDHPMFIEFGYNYMYSYKVSILDATNAVDVITLSEGDSNDFSAHYFIIRVGIAIF